MNDAGGALREAGARRRPARRRLRRRLLRTAGVAEGGRRRRSCRWPTSTSRRARRSRRRLPAVDAGRPDADETDASCATQYLARQLAALRAARRDAAGTKLTFDEESKALYDAVAPTHTEAGVRGGARRSSRRGCPGTGRSSSATTRSASSSSSRADRLDAVFKAAIDGCRSRTLAAHHAAARRELHRRIRHRQELERLQLVSGQLQQPDPGQHRPADLRRSRDRSRVPRRLPGSSRLQRAAREEPASAIAAGSSSRSTRCSRRSR